MTLITVAPDHHLAHNFTGKASAPEFPGELSSPTSVEFNRLHDQMFQFDAELDALVQHHRRSLQLTASASAAAAAPGPCTASVSV